MALFSVEPAEQDAAQDEQPQRFWEGDHRPTREIGKDRVPQEHHHTAERKHRDDEVDGEEIRAFPGVHGMRFLCVDRSGLHQFVVHGL